MADATHDTNAGAQAPLQVKVPDDLQKGVYANAVSVNVNNNEIVCDFGYLLPNTPDPIIEVVSRVNMNHRTAESFLNVLKGAMEDFEKKKAESAAPAPVPGAPAAPAATAPHPAPAPAPMPAAGPTPGAPMPPLPEHS
jgi:hypothetical protein